MRSNIELPCLYHYTDINTFEKIITNKTLRLCSSDCMRDRRDAKYYADIIIKWATEEDLSEIADAFQRQQ